MFLHKTCKLIIGRKLYSHFFFYAVSAKNSVETTLSIFREKLTLFAAWKKVRKKSLNFRGFSRIFDGIPKKFLSNFSIWKKWASKLFDSFSFVCKFIYKNMRRWKQFSEVSQTCFWVFFQLKKQENLVFDLFFIFNSQKPFWSCVSN